jgi:hypothetical protein
VNPNEPDHQYDGALEKEPTPGAQQSSPSDEADEVVAGLQEWRAKYLDVPLIVLLLDKIADLWWAEPAESDAEALWQNLENRGQRLSRNRTLFVAAEALGQIRDESTVAQQTQLIENLGFLISNGNSLHRVRALRAMRFLASPDCTPHIEAALRDESAWVQSTAISTLFDIKPTISSASMMVMRLLGRTFLRSLAFRSDAFRVFKGLFAGLWSHSRSRILVLLVVCAWLGTVGLWALAAYVVIRLISFGPKLQSLIETISYTTSLLILAGGACLARVASAARQKPFAWLSFAFAFALDAILAGLIWSQSTYVTWMLVFLYAFLGGAIFVLLIKDVGARRVSLLLLRLIMSVIACSVAWNSGGAPRLILGALTVLFGSQVLTSAYRVRTDLYRSRILRWVLGAVACCAGIWLIVMRFWSPISLLAQRAGSVFSAASTWPAATAAKSVFDNLSQYSNILNTQFKERGGHIDVSDVVLPIGVLAISCFGILAADRLILSIRIRFSSKRYRIQGLRDYIMYVASVAQDHGLPVGVRKAVVATLVRLPLADPMLNDFLLRLADSDLPLSVQDAFYQAVDASEKRLERGQVRSVVPDTGELQELSMAILKAGPVFRPLIRAFLVIAAIAGITVIVGLESWQQLEPYRVGVMRAYSIVSASLLALGASTMGIVSRVRMWLIILGCCILGAAWSTPSWSPAVFSSFNVVLGLSIAVGLIGYFLYHLEADAAVASQPLWARSLVLLLLALFCTSLPAPAVAEIASLMRDKVPKFETTARFSVRLSQLPVDQRFVRVVLVRTSKSPEKERGIASHSLNVRQAQAVPQAGDPAPKEEKTERILPRKKRAKDSSVIVWSLSPDAYSIHSWGRWVTPWSDIERQLPAIEATFPKVLRVGVTNSGDSAKLQLEYPIDDVAGEVWLFGDGHEVHSWSDLPQACLKSRLESGGGAVFEISDKCTANREMYRLAAILYSRSSTAAIREVVGNRSVDLLMERAIPGQRLRAETLTPFSRVVWSPVLPKEDSRSEFFLH